MRKCFMHLRSWHLSTAVQASGRGVNIYVISAGVNAAHHEFSSGTKNSSRSRVIAAYSAAADGSAAVDFRGEGTAAAALVAGRSLGVARAATIHSVKVFDDSSAVYAATEEQVLRGVRWVLVRAAARLARRA